MSRLNFHHGALLKKMGCSLVYTDDQKRHFGQYTRAFTLADPPQEVAKAIRGSHCIHVHPDGFDYWIDVLIVLQEKSPLQIQLFCITGSDYTIRDEHIQYWIAAFPAAKFWIQNYCGSFSQCTMLPIGCNFAHEITEKHKIRTLIISHFNELNSEERSLLKQLLDVTPELQQYRMPHQSAAEYSEQLGKSKFSVCPTGNGFDTMRFWESLSEKSIPIVLQNDFTRNLSLQYPNLPFVMISGWNELLPWSQQDLNALYEFLLQRYSDFSCVTEAYWLEKLETILSKQALEC